MLHSVPYLESIQSPCRRYVNMVGTVVTHYHIALTDVRRRTKFSIRSSPSACVSCSFLIRRMRSLSGEVRSIRRKAHNLELTPPEKGARLLYGSYALAYVLFGTRALPIGIASANQRQADSRNWPKSSEWCVPGLVQFTSVDVRWT